MQKRHHRWDVGSGRFAVGDRRECKHCGLVVQCERVRGTIRVQWKLLDQRRSLWWPAHNADIPECVRPRTEVVDRRWYKHEGPMEDAGNLPSEDIESPPLRTMPDGSPVPSGEELLAALKEAAFLGDLAAVLKSEILRGHTEEPWPSCFGGRKPTLSRYDEQ